MIGMSSSSCHIGMLFCLNQNHLTIRGRWIGSRLYCRDLRLNVQCKAWSEEENSLEDRVVSVLHVHHMQCINGACFRLAWYWTNTCSRHCVCMDKYAMHVFWQVFPGADEIANAPSIYPESVIKKFGHANILLLFDSTEIFAEVASMKIVNSIL